MPIIKLDATDSTNAYLKRLIASNVSQDFTVVVARNQLKGRGQMGTHWISEEGKNLTFSVLKKNKDLSTDDSFLLNIIVSLAIVDSLKGFQVPDLKIKWPNDILSGTSKICGILIENIISGNKIKASIIGIGLNTNQTIFHNVPKASSLKLLLGKTLDLDELLKELLNSLESIFQDVQKKGSEELWEAYGEILFRKDKPSTFQDSNKKKIMGFIRGVSAEGKLIIELEDNVKKEFGFKEVTLLY
ncbi:biotin--[acetyl-CoA-carboxylase] ligase [Ulvibacterium marinum]|uniref:Biotin--[acetyl-CoA-carboxylase] ligase n=1 Tax=Ulvibacterium marinum TaxID=2419782 RepID=A0A3B0C1A2_9FLAO|nr:biotin--[acetyl-CoA-carboxylase] ligase [Ulvibacterium marinum]RKN78368.1 biotin--[acetyl-CoA-carboxylase] ligase [Ulvibacterium marinum]